MHLAFHGGLCCGIKTIYGFYGHPDEKNAEELSAIPANNADSYGNQVASHERFFHEAAPRETGRERLDRYLDYLKRRRPSGIVEVVLATDNGYPDQVGCWEPLLLERGFKEVTRAYNSNSENTCIVYHLVMAYDTEPETGMGCDCCPCCCDCGDY